MSSLLLAIGEPWKLSPDLTGSITKSVVAVLITFVVVVPAFALFRYDRASAGRSWHEPAWRPSTIGYLGLGLTLTTLIGWHGLRLAILLAREWTKVFG